jgi:hypothetical protein
MTETETFNRMREIEADMKLKSLAFCEILSQLRRQEMLSKMAFVKAKASLQELHDLRKITVEG